MFPRAYSSHRKTRNHHPFLLFFGTFVVVLKLYKLQDLFIKVTMDNLKCNYLATSPPFILQAVRSRRMKQVILEVDKTQLVVRGVQQPTL